MVADRARPHLSLPHRAEELHRLAKRLRRPLRISAFLARAGGGTVSDRVSLHLRLAPRAEQPKRSLSYSAFLARTHGSIAGNRVDLHLGLPHRAMELRSPFLGSAVLDSADGGTIGERVSVHDGPPCAEDLKRTLPASAILARAVAALQVIVFRSSLTSPIA